MWEDWYSLTAEEQIERLASDETEAQALRDILKEKKESFCVLMSFVESARLSGTYIIKLRKLAKSYREFFDLMIIENTGQSSLNWRKTNDKKF